MNKIATILLSVMVCVQLLWCIVLQLQIVSIPRPAQLQAPTLDQAELLKKIEVHAMQQEWAGQQIEALRNYMGTNEVRVALLAIQRQRGDAYMRHVVQFLETRPTIEIPDLVTGIMVWVPYKKIDAEKAEELSLEFCQRLRPAVFDQRKK